MDCGQLLLFSAKFGGQLLQFTANLLQTLNSILQLWIILVKVCDSKKWSAHSLLSEVRCTLTVTSTSDGHERKLHEKSA